MNVVNYLPFDSLGQPPAVTISTSADLDPLTVGIQVQNGTTVRVNSNVTDDVQVRNVELLVDGVVVQNDVAFPFDLSAVALETT